MIFIYAYSRLVRANNWICNAWAQIWEGLYLRTYPRPHADSLAGHFHIGMTDGLRGGRGCSDFMILKLG